jgi:hypothetical protein
MLGKCDFFIYVKRVIKETKQIHLLSFGYVERKAKTGERPKKIKG